MLTYIQINAAKPREKAWSLSDAQGLLLIIQPNGSKLWRFRYRFLDKQKTLHLGGWPQLSGGDVAAKCRDQHATTAFSGKPGAHSPSSDEVASVRRPVETCLPT